MEIEPSTFKLEWFDSHTCQLEFINYFLNIYLQIIVKLNNENLNKKAQEKERLNGVRETTLLMQ